MDNNEESNSFISFHRIYNDDSDLRNNRNIVFDFQVTYTLAPRYNSEGEEDLQNLETRTVDQTEVFEKEWLIGGDRAEIQNHVFFILALIETPSYSQIVEKLTNELCDLKECNAVSALLNLERVKVEIDVVVLIFPDEEDVDEEDVDDVDVKLAVAPASDEAVEQHLETVVLENESFCVICMDKIGVGSDEAAVRMPCSHLFHRTCGEDWLRTSGICPVCRAVFPS